MCSIMCSNKIRKTSFCKYLILYLFFNNFNFYGNIRLNEARMPNIMSWEQIMIKNLLENEMENTNSFSMKLLRCNEVIMCVMHNSNNNRIFNEAREKLNKNAFHFIKWRE